MHLLRNYTFRYVFLVLVLICTIGLLITYHSQQTDMRHCFMQQPDYVWRSEEFSDRERLDDIMLSEKKPTPGRSIFFLETTCNQRPPTHISLKARQACAIESAALHNPNFSVYVLYANPVYQFKNKSALPLIDAILSYPNVYLRNVNLWTYAAGTPIYDWLKDGKLFQSSYIISHTSDFLRYLTLWRWGGTYLDMDTITLRSLEDLPPNYTAAETDVFLAAGVMNFAPTGFGHEVAQQCLHYFQRNFDGNDWGNNGPGVITNVLRSICGTTNIDLMMDSKRCLGFQVFNPDVFYAIPSWNWNKFFETEHMKYVLERLKNAYVAHVWNNFSKKRILKVGEDAAYSKLAELHCPRVIAAAGEYF